MYKLDELDYIIIKTIEEFGEYRIKNVSDVEMKYITELGIHILHTTMSIVYDRGALVHFLKTKDEPGKTNRLTPSQTLAIIIEPEIILPNFSPGKENSYMYARETGIAVISIVEVLLDKNKIRITHGGFEVLDLTYLRKAKELRNTILEGRHSLMSQYGPKSND